MSRAAAKQLGLLWYVDARVCPKGHVGRRRTRDGKCSFCLRERGRKQAAKQRTTVNGRAINLLVQARRRAKIQQVPFSLTPEWVKIRLRAGVCAITGLPFDFATGRGRWVKHPYVPSIDRVEPAKGYTPENCRVVCLIVNEAMNQWGFEPLLAVARRLVEVYE